MKGRVKTPVIYQSVRYHGWIKVNRVWKYGTARAQTWPTWLWDQWCPAVLVFRLWRMTQRSSLRSILCWVIAWPCSKGKLELQLRNTPCRTVGVDLRVRYLSGQCLTAPWGGDGGSGFTCSFLGFMLYQVDSCPPHDLWHSWEGSSGLGTVSWNVHIGDFCLHWSED